MVESSSNAAAGLGHRGVDGEEGERGPGGGLVGDGPAQGEPGEVRGDRGPREEAMDATGGPHDSQLDSVDGARGNENFSEITKEGEKFFACNVCLDEFDQPRKVKSHISKKHLKHTNEPTKKRKGEEDLDKNEIKKQKSQSVFSESILEEFEKTGMFTSTQVGGDDIAPEVFTDESVLEQTIVRAPPESFEDATNIILDLDEKVKKLEDELKVARKEIADKDNIISVKEDALQVSKGTLNSVEDEYKKSLTRIARLEKALANMKTEIDFLRGAKIGGDKVKKLEKDLKESETRAALNVKKVEELVVAKATIEAELVRMKKVCDLQMESLDRSKNGDGQDFSRKNRQEEMKKVDVKCKQFESAAGCSYSEGCRFLHPTAACEWFTKVGKCPINDCKDVHRKMTNNKENNGDCYFWLNGSCRFSEADCNKGRHIQEKFGVNRRQESFLGQGLGSGERATTRGQELVGLSQPTLGGQQHMISTVMGGMGVHPSMGGQHQVMDNQYQAIANQQQQRVGGRQQTMSVQQAAGGHQNSMGGISYLGGQQLVNGGNVGGFQPAMFNGQQIPGSRDAGQSGMETGNMGAQEDSMNITPSSSSSSSMNRGWPGPQRMGGR